MNIQLCSSDDIFLLVQRFLALEWTSLETELIAFPRYLQMDGLMALPN